MKRLPFIAATLCCHPRSVKSKRSRQKPSSYQFVWKGRRSYASLHAALADAETGVARWMREELEITVAT